MRMVRIMSDRDDAEEYRGKLVDDTYDGSINITEAIIDADLDYDKIGWRIVRSTVREGYKDLDLELSNRSGKVGLVEGSTVWIAKPIDTEAFDIDFVDMFGIYDYCKVGCFGIEKADTKYVFYVLAPDKTTALKIANEVYSSVRILEDTKSVVEGKIYSINGLKIMNEDGIL